MSHFNAPLTLVGELLVVARIQVGMPQAYVAVQMGVSRAAVGKWWHRFCEHGDTGLVDWLSKPHRSPRRISAAVEFRVCRLRCWKRWGPVRIATRLGLPASTMHRVLVRNGLRCLSGLDRSTGKVIRRYERAELGDLIHIGYQKNKVKFSSGGG